MKDITGTRELSYAELEHKLEDCEDALTAHDELIQSMAAANESMLKQLDALRHYYEGRRRKDIFVHGLGIGDPEHYFRTFANKTKEDVLMKLMEAEQSLFDEGLLEQASGI